MKQHQRTELDGGKGIIPRNGMPCLAAIAVLLLLAGHGLAGCGSSGRGLTPRRPPLLENVTQFEVKLILFDALNTPRNDFGVTMPLDSTILFFTSEAAEGERTQSILYSRKSGGAWGAPKQAVEINNGFSNGMPSIALGGEAMYFTGDEYGLGDCDLYRVDIGPRGTILEETIPWSIPVNLGLRINGTYWDSEPCISSDGSVLYFASNRPGGLGGRDIWVSRRGRDGAWERPINAGEAINTEFDEVTPWLSPDGQTLFFSSNGHPGLGGFDVFMATEAAEVTVVRHLGSPINSNANDICFSLSANGSRAFMASNRPGGKGGLDIYEVSPIPVPVDPLMIVHGSVHGKDGRPLIATVEVTDLTSDQLLGHFLTNPESGEYHLILPRGYNYVLTAQAPDHLFNSQQVLVPRDLERNTEQTVDFSLQPIKGAIRLLLFFDPNESNLKRESRPDLDRAGAFLEANPDITVEIAGHSDNSGDAKAALELSRQRAQAVKSYLVGNRIVADRIKVVGYGSTQPISSNDTEAGRAMNRRVEMRIIESP